MVDTCKIKRDKSRFRKDFKKQFTPPKESLSKFFDGRKDTLFVDTFKAKQFRRNVNEEHSLIQEPKSTYIGHVSTSLNSSYDITQSILSRLSDLSILLEILEVLGYVAL